MYLLLSVVQRRPSVANVTQSRVDVVVRQLETASMLPNAAALGSRAAGPRALLVCICGPRPTVCIRTHYWDTDLSTKLKLNLKKNTVEWQLKYFVVVFVFDNTVIHLYTVVILYKS